MKLLTLNAGSSSIRFAFFDSNDGEPVRLADGKLERLGDDDPVPALLDQLSKRPEFAGVEAIGHRVVHGMDHAGPALVRPDLIRELQRIQPFDPEHMPREIELIQACQSRWPKLGQVACFDTAFHRTMPRVAKLLPLPRRFDEKGVRRYGFHGLSYTYLLRELHRLGDPAARSGRVILAHLGNGASMAAVRNGESVDTTMSFTPTAGLVMGTRTGDLDPGLVAYLAKQENIDVDAFEKMVNHDSGLVGMSETSSDVRDLLEHENEDVRAAEALAVFCYQAKKWIGALSAALGGLDTLVFAGGIGEHATPIRERICQGLDYLGVALDAPANASNAAIVSTPSSRVTVRVIPTDEEVTIARSVCEVLRRKEESV